ncbi:MAG: TIGR03564 family F420-dependent LLM class oxidoreductase [Acidimicrobiales bacterium]|nr:TIGR03564 family F420-dependent LLM class oxidoreductase [Acidimicrobiales bacterium]
MRIGINGTALVAKASVAAVVEHARQAEADGFDAYWLAEHPSGGFDALTVLGMVGQSVSRLALGTAVIPTYPRHPLVLAGQARTVASTMSVPLTLGIGLSHQPMLAALGLRDDKPIRHLRDYLSVLQPLLERGEVDHAGPTIECRAKLFAPPEPAVPVVVAALGPQMLRLAGARTAGTSLAWVGVNTIRDHIVPTISDAAAAAGRPAPRIIATLPICVTEDPASVRARISAGAAWYAELPSYKAMFAREGVQSPGEVGLVGSESEVEDRLGELAEAGVTDYSASEFTTSPQEQEQTRALLRRVARATAGRVG